MTGVQFINDILKQDESDQLEFREIVRLDAIGKVICGFLNNNGGQLIIGVTDKKAIIGVSNAKNHAASIEEFLLKEIVPEAPIMVSIEQVDDKEVILVKVWTGSKKPYIFLGAIFYRRGNSTIQASTKELSAIIHERSQAEFQWERLPVTGIELADFDLEEIQKCIDATPSGFKDQAIEDIPLNFLSYYGLYQNGQFTNAAVILFAKQPFRFIPQSRVRLALLQEGKTSDTFIFDKLLEGNLFKNLIEVQVFFEKAYDLLKSFDDKSWQRRDFSYPVSALREGVINALVHSDYSMISGSISVIIYKDRLEITNVGKLPIPVSELKRNHLSMPFNPDIAHIVFLRGYMEKIGRGTIKIIEACKQVGLRQPTWRNANNIVNLSFYNEKAGSINKGALEGLIDGAIKGAFPYNMYKGAALATVFNLGMGALIAPLGGLIGSSITGITDKVKENLVLLMSTIFKNEGNRVPDYTELTGLSTSTVERYIKLLRDADLIDFKGDAAQTGGYYLTEKSKSQIIIEE